MTKQVIEYLSKHEIRKTPFRIELLELFLKSKKSLSHQDIKEQIISTQDKVTIYRALDTFLEKGLIHKVPDLNNVSKYALCPPQCSVEAHEHNHIHFMCDTCEETYCIELVNMPSINLPKGFIMKNSTFTVNGVCVNCTKN